MPDGGNAVAMGKCSNAQLRTTVCTMADGGNARDGKMLECTVEDNCVHYGRTVEMLAMGSRSNSQLRTTVCTMARRWKCSRDEKSLACTVEDNCVHDGGAFAPGYAFLFIVSSGRCPGLDERLHLRCVDCAGKLIREWRCALDAYRASRRSSCKARSEVWPLQLQRDYATWDSPRRRRSAANPAPIAKIANDDSSGTALMGARPQN